MHCPFCARLNLYCLPHSVECVQSQKELGWHACGSLGCWTSSTACAYMQRGFHSRPLVADASTDGTGAPNMFSRRSVTIESMSYPVKVQIDHRDFIQGSADGGGCNRLIHTLGQCIGDHFLSSQIEFGSAHSFASASRSQVLMPYIHILT